MNNKCIYQITLKNFPYRCCNAQKYCPPVLCPDNYLECPVYSQEYNTDTSAQPLSNKGEDIVRPIFNNEDIELEDKEPLG